MQDIYLWIGPLTFLIKTALTGCIVASVLRPFHSQHRRALIKGTQTAAGLGSSIKHMWWDVWGKAFAKHMTTSQVAGLRQHKTDSPLCWNVLG